MRSFIVSIVFIALNHFEIHPDDVGIPLFISVIISALVALWQDVKELTK